MRSDDLVPLLVPPPMPGMGFRQGTVTSFDSDTGENVISVGGASLSNVPMLNSGEAVALKAGHVVALLTWKSSWWILGRVTLPNSDQFASASVAFDAAGTEATGFSLSTTPTAKATAVLDVPAWADEALVLAISSARVVNESAFDDVCFSTVRIAGQDGSEMLGVAAASGSFSLTSVTAQHRRIIVSPASTISCQAMLSTSNSTWSANATNRCAIDAIAIYRSTS